jgi:hypothetical protein
MYLPLKYAQQHPLQKLVKPRQSLGHASATFVVCPQPLPTSRDGEVYVWCWARVCGVWVGAPHAQPRLAATDWPEGLHSCMLLCMVLQTYRNSSNMHHASCIQQSECIANLDYLELLYQMHVCLWHIWLLGWPHPFQRASVCKHHEMLSSTAHVALVGVKHAYSVVLPAA